MASDRTSIDPGLLELFQSEMDAHIPVLSQGLLALEKGGVDEKQIAGMMRAAHSIKGAARIVGIDPAVRVAHAMEDCFTAAKEKKITLASDSVDVLLRGVDALQRICSPADDALPSEDELRSLLEAIAGVKSGATAPRAAVGGVGASASPAVSPAQSSAAAENDAPARPDLVAARVSPDEPSVTIPAGWSPSVAEGLRKQFLDTLNLRPNRIQVDFRHVERVPAGLLALLASVAEALPGLSPEPTVVATGLQQGTAAVMRGAGLSAVFVPDERQQRKL